LFREQNALHSSKAVPRMDEAEVADLEAARQDAL
jgi:hypothetical protein